jgi:Sulfatase
VKKFLNAHPILFAIFPALSIVADHIEFITLNKTVILISLSILTITALLFLLLKWLWHSADKAAACTSLSLILFFSYGHTFDYLTKILAIPFIQHRHLFLLWIIFYLILFVMLFRTKRSMVLLNRWLTAVGIMLILFSGISILSYYQITDTSWQPEVALANNATSPSTNYPDIYYIILDAYANEATLKTFYGFENEEFLAGLEARGFFIADKSRSNYALTSLSLSSSLNLNYVNEIAQQAGENSDSIAIPMQAIENNQAMQFLKTAGYQLIFLGSGYGVSQSNRQADIEIKCGLVDETIGRFIATSLLRAPADRFRLVEQDDRQRRLCMFAELSNLPAMDGPKFVFAHVPSPHWPFLFDAQGNSVSLENLTQDQLKEGYLEQLIYLNGRVNQIVDAILANSSQEPIIIIQSDHGPAFEVSMDNPSQQLYQERMRILNAYYLPEEAQTMLYPTITPINSFRVLFNYLFATELPLLDDQSYFSNYEFPYKFTNVTESIRSN